MLPVCLAGAGLCVPASADVKGLLGVQRVWVFALRQGVRCGICASGSKRARARDREVVGRAGRWLYGRVCSALRRFAPKFPSHLNGRNAFGHTHLGIRMRLWDMLGACFCSTSA